MNRRSIILFLAVSSFAFGCSQGQITSSLPPQEFANKIKQSGEATVLDVRTPEEFASGHIAKARNIDWNGDSFEKEVSQLDKSKPVFVYCLRGPRSSSATAKMRSMGFKEVYELNGGLTKWLADNLPVSND